MTLGRQNQGRRERSPVAFHPAIAPALDRVAVAQHPQAPVAAVADDAPGTGADVAPKADLVPVHFEGTTKLFLSILGWLLGLTLIEVFLAYIHVPLHIMLTILIGLSLIKAALIVAYFMHLRFERLSLVLTLIPMLVVCVCLLLVFFPDSFRSNSLRYKYDGGAPAATAGEGH